MSAKHILVALSASFVATTTANAEGLYFGAYGGVGSVGDIDDLALSFDTDFVFGAVIGTSLSETVRIEGELSYLGAPGDEECFGKCVVTDFDISTLTLLGNAWVDFDAGTGLKPYVGGGLGLARVSIDSGFSEGGDTGLAYQIGLGARFGARDQFDIGYRYRGASVDIDEFGGEIDIDSHMLQFRWTGRF